MTCDRERGTAESEVQHRRQIREITAFDINLYNQSRDELIESISAASERRFSYIVTPNVNHVVQLEHDEALQWAYAGASHRVCDSRVLQMVLTLIGQPVQEVIPGSDLTSTLMDIAQSRSWRVCVIGCGKGDMAELKRRYPRITFFHHDPPMGFITQPREVSTCIDFVAANHAQLTVLSVGCPRQEVLARKILDDGRSRGVGLCVGASLNFLSGKVQRAPLWMQQTSLEWLHRMCSEPGRLIKRYAVDAIRVIPIILRNLR